MHFGVTFAIYRLMKFWLFCVCGLLLPMIFIPNQTDREEYVMMSSITDLIKVYRNQSIPEYERVGCRGKGDGIRLNIFNKKVGYL